MTALDDLRAGDLTVEQLTHYLANRRAREQLEGATFAGEWDRLIEQARAIRVASAMVIEDGFPGEVVREAVAAEFPGHEDAIAAAVDDAVAELAR